MKRSQMTGRAVYGRGLKLFISLLVYNQLSSSIIILFSQAGEAYSTNVEFCTFFQKCGEIIDSLREYLKWMPNT